MKKMLRKILVLALATTIFIMPASTVLAASNPVVYGAGTDYISIEFEPDPLHLQPGIGFELSNFAESTHDWYVSAGKGFYISIFTTEASTTARIQVYKNGSLIQDGVTSSTMHAYEYRYAPTSVANRYRVVLTALTDMHIESYFVVTES